MQFGWTKLHNAVTEKTVSASLTIREREVARMAAFGYSDQEIADHLKLSKHTVKSLISMAKNKTGTMKRSELAAFI
jgi:DNA-binding CsgD family transcriptional regulator